MDRGRLETRAREKQLSIIETNSDEIQRGTNWGGGDDFKTNGIETITGSSDDLKNWRVKKLKQFWEVTTSKPTASEDTLPACRGSSDYLKNCNK